MRHLPYPDRLSPKRVVPKQTIADEDTIYGGANQFGSNPMTSVGYISNHEVRGTSSGTLVRERTRLRTDTVLRPRATCIERSLETR